MNKNFIFHDGGKVLETMITVQLSDGKYTTYSVFYDLVNNKRISAPSFSDVQQPFFKPDRSCCISLPELPEVCQIYVSATENLGWLYESLTLFNFAFYTQISSFVVNGVEQLLSPVGIQITPDNADIVEIGGEYGVNNITNALNNLSTDFIFQLVGINEHGAWYMSVMYPYDYEWSITLTGTRTDPSPAKYTYDIIDGVILTNEGLQCVYYYGTTGCGPVYETGSPARYLSPLNKTCY